MDVNRAPKSMTTFSSIVFRRSVALPRYFAERDNQGFSLGQQGASVGEGNSCHREEVRLSGEVGRGYRAYAAPQFRQEFGGCWHTAGPSRYTVRPREFGHDEDIYATE